MKIKDTIKRLQEYYDKFGDLEILDELDKPAAPDVNGYLDVKGKCSTIFIRFVDEMDL